MKVVALISGGKDSCYNMMQCVAEGHTITALANLKPKDKDELDSYMFQTVGHHAIDLYAEAMDLPLYRRTLEGSSVEIGKDYEETPQDEVEDLYALLKEVKEKTGIEGVSVGAILSDYQRVRVEHVCSRLGLTSIAYLWRRDQMELLKEMIDCGVDAQIIKVAALGLEPKKHLGKTLAEIYPHMEKMQDQYGLNMCGEGGEYETFTVDCPLFKKKIIIDEVEQVIHSDDAFAPVGYLNLKKMHLKPKTSGPSGDSTNRLEGLPMKRGEQLMGSILVEEEQENLVCSSNEEPLAIRNDPEDIFTDDKVCLHHKKNGFFFISNLIGLEKDDLTLGEVTKLVMEKLQESLEGNGYSLTDLVINHLYVKDMADFNEINAVYKTYFNINPPSRICIQACLPSNVCIQMDCIGYQPKEIVLLRNTMHVQGLSHWAPANIGPYSQAVQIGNSIFVAGQISMCPSDLQIIKGGILPEARLSLYHVKKVLEAMNTKACLTCVHRCICYVTKKEYIAVAQQTWEKERESDLLKTGEKCVCNIEYVVVPTLPKGSLIEWQVCANVGAFCGEICDSYQESGTLVKGTIELCKKQRLDPESESVKDEVFWCKLYVDRKNDQEEIPKESEVIDMLYKVLSFILVMNKFDGDINMLRIFYHQKYLRHGEICTAFEECLKSLKIPLTATFVPVQGFAGHNRLLCALS